ncbi:class I SAM-dependent methyltransferase [Pararhodospirillum photometricum]|uniref:class I SAM-dependent methyltransferase n=1 Tax=Pararhodospirillum photometricum TaxID=1084 RepID=UPI0002EAADAA|nr:50S ribosomal protein L11 methyltransferase [Pararhodospirillum photometricum]
MSVPLGRWRDFIKTHAAPTAPPLLPALPLWLATAVTPLWEATETFLEQEGLDPPYWAFCWPGGQALARYVLDHPECVRDLRVLDFAAGSGVCALAALHAGARSAEAADIDACARAAIGLNAELNGLTPTVLEGNVVGALDRGWDVVLAGDICYERPMTDRVLPWLRHLAGRGTRVLLGDPGRAYLPTHGLAPLGRYEVPCSLDLEDRALRSTGILALLP